MVWLLEFLFQEREILHDGSTISDVALSHTLHLDFVFAGLHVLDDVLFWHHFETIGFETVVCLLVEIALVDNYFLACK